MSNPQQSQFPFPDSQLKIYNWLEDDDENISETKEKNDEESEEVDRDWFLEAFLVGYRMEKERRQRMEAEVEEREKKAIAEKKIEKERRREERENFEMCLMKELKCLRNTIETMKEEEERLRLEIEELKKSSKEENTVKVIVEIVNREDKMKEVVIPKSQVPTPSPKFQVPSPKPPISTVQTQVTVPSPNPQSQSLSQSQSQVKEGVVEEEEEKEVEGKKREEKEEEETEVTIEEGSREEMEEDEEIDFKCICQHIGCQKSESQKSRWRGKIENRKQNRELEKRIEDVVIPQWQCPCQITKCPNKIGKWTKEKLEKRERKILRRKWREENRKENPLITKS